MASSSLTLRRLLPKPRSIAAASRLFSTAAPTPEQSNDRPVPRKDEVQKAPVVVLFHASGLTSNQWRKLKNLWHPGKTLFRPAGASASAGAGGNKSQFFELAGRSSGPTSVLYLPDGEAAEKLLPLLPSEESAGQDMLLLYGQYESSLVGHVDIAKVSEPDEAESSLFGFYLPGSYLCSVLDPVFTAENENADENEKFAEPAQA